MSSSSASKSSSSEILAAHRGISAKVPIDQLFTRKELVGKGAYGGVYKVCLDPLEAGSKLMLIVTGWVQGNSQSDRSRRRPQGEQITVNSRGRQLVILMHHHLQVIDLDTPDDDITEIQKEVALLSEMRDAARHNITLYHGCYLNGYELWIAMDFASGGSIRTLVSLRVVVGPATR